MNNIVDYTKMRANKKLRLIKCPKCNRTGVLHKYTDGTANITHSGRIVLKSFFEVKDSCYFEKWNN